MPQSTAGCCQISSTLHARSSNEDQHRDHGILVLLRESLIPGRSPALLGAPPGPAGTALPMFPLLTSHPDRLACILPLSLWKQSSLPKLSRLAEDTSAWAPSLEMSLSSELHFPLLQPLGFLHFLPHKPLSGSSLQMHINCSLKPRWGRQSKCRASGQA